MPPPPGFDEAEHALALISGKDPEIVRKARALRELDEQAAAERALREEELARERRAARLRTASVVLAVSALGLGACWAAYVAFSRAQRESTERERAARWLAGTAAPMAKQGLALRETAIGPAKTVTLSTRLGGCLFVHAADERGSVPVRIRRDAAAELTAERGVAFCLCEDEAVTVRVEGGGDLPAAIGIHQAPAAAIGGTEGLSAMDPPPPAIAATGATCAGEQLRAWLPRGGQALAKSRVSGATGALVDGLGSARLALVGRGSARTRLVPVATESASCYLAIATTKDTLTLTDGDPKPLARGDALAWCDKAAAPRAITHVGDGEVLVGRVASAEIGSLAGTLDVARRLGVSAPATWLDPTALAQATAELLAKSHVILPKPAEGGALAASPSLRLAVISRSASTPEDTGALVCAAGPPQQLLCLVPPGVAWRTSTLGEVGVAAAPFWVAAAAEPRGLAAMMPVFALVRSLARAGFEPTTLEGITESAASVEVSGRAGDDAVVAVAISPSAPWVLPLSEGPSWKLGDAAPRVVPLAPGGRLSLRNPMLGAMPPATRRTIVFRHLASAATPAASSSVKRPY